MWDAMCKLRTNVARQVRKQHVHAAAARCSAAAIAGGARSVPVATLLRSLNSTLLLWTLLCCWPALPRGNGGYSPQQVFVRLFIDADLRAHALSRGTRCGVVGGGLLPTLGPPITR